MTTLAPATEIRYELDRLAEYSDAALLAEIRRVAAIIEEKYISRAEFSKHARASCKVIVSRFGAWQHALEKAGLSQRARPVHVTQEMRTQPGKSKSREDLIKELRRVASIVGQDNLTLQNFNENSLLHTSLIIRRFGSWHLASTEAGVEGHARSRRYSEEECFENILNVWAHYGRAPRFREINAPPSLVGIKVYLTKWRTFKKHCSLSFKKWRVVLR